MRVKMILIVDGMLGMVPKDVEKDQMKWKSLQNRYHPDFSIVEIDQNAQCYIPGEPDNDFYI